MISPAVMPLPGAAQSDISTRKFAGSYTDPNHPGCTRDVKADVEDPLNGLIITGTDVVGGLTWSVKAKAIGDSGLLVDFSPKGGSANVHAEWIDDAIKFPDGNVWTKVPNLTFAGTSLKFAGSYIDPNHPGCTRDVKADVENFLNGVVITGTDVVGGPTWSVKAKVNGDSGLLVDFSPKGGSAKVPAEWIGDAFKFPDGNVWTKVPTVKSLKFAGSYIDPNHPGCTRDVKADVEDLFNGVVITGTDVVGGRTWSVKAKFIGDIGLLVDFSPKGGPTDVPSEWIGDAFKFPDGNVWTKVPTVKSLKFAGSYIDPYHPGCTRDVKADVEDLLNGVVITGTDTVGGLTWSVKARVIGDSGLLVDFRPKGGPTSVPAEWIGDAFKFPDGNVWTKVPTLKFAGSYIDPNHPGCTRDVKADVKDLLNGVVITGTDTVGGRTWSVKAKVNGDIGLLVDFSPKGGPAKVPAEWIGGVFKFPDGNVWTKIT